MSLIKIPSLVSFGNTEIIVSVKAPQVHHSGQNGRTLILIPSRSYTRTMSTSQDTQLWIVSHLGPFRFCRKGLWDGIFSRVVESGWSAPSEGRRGLDGIAFEPIRAWFLFHKVGCGKLRRGPLQDLEDNSPRFSQCLGPHGKQSYDTLCNRRGPLSHTTLH